MRRGGLQWTFFGPILAILVLGLAVAGGLSGRQYRNHFIADTRQEREDRAGGAGPRFPSRVD